MIEYRYNFPINPRTMSALFSNSGITRPIDDIPRLAVMLARADLVLSAWAGERLIGLCRALTDYRYCCYVSDLAVDRDHQRQGVGRRLLDMVAESLGDEVTIVLLSNERAMDYYPNAGFTGAENAFLIKRRR